MGRNFEHLPHQRSLHDPGQDTKARLNSRDQPLKHGLIVACAPVAFRVSEIIRHHPAVLAVPVIRSFRSVSAFTLEYPSALGVK
ncbi:hypothetical protein AAFF_G00139810 [Aldrovandia affinis]|uniref:Uncharacterized protein n=1 Tax=Aldrovandia affinis TaxID=143900 RepID=A0AAD7X2P6_9TELE|nr:hypothetical protein AAFF_G00139810 [Aldrovandia affinis]